MKDVLLVDDDAEMMQSLARALSPLIAPLTLNGAGSHERAIETATKNSPVVAVIDLCIDERQGVESGFALLRAIRALDETIRIIILTGHGSADNGIRALTCGAASFIEKPVDPHHLAALIKDGAIQAELKRRYQALASSRADRLEAELVGTSTAAEVLRERIRFVASTNQPVLLLGETGTGKGHCARLIHQHSSRCDKKFVHYHPNFGGGDLVQSELFGHVKGAFTGATDARRGLISEAHGGTLFFDELDEIPADTQVKLLDLVQEKRMRPVGADAFQAVDCRVIAASNCSIDEVLASGKLRRDLYHRIAHTVVEVPSLRERWEDLPCLARSILSNMRVNEEINVFDFEPGALELLSRYSWPGNIRELQGAVQTAAYYARFKARSVITEEDLVQAVKASSPAPASENDSAASLPELVHRYKISLIHDALSRSNGNQLHAARELGIDRGTLRRLLCSSDAKE